MVSLLDIAPAAETATIHGQEVAVYGVSVAGLATLINRFPELQALFSGQEVDPNRLIGFGTEVVAAIIAAGTGSPANEKAEAVAASLGLDDQLTLLEKILRLTLPQGIGPFVEKLNAVTQALGGGGVSVSNTPAPSNS